MKRKSVFGEDFSRYLNFSGRELVIITCALLDSTLERLIESKLIKDDKAIKEFLGTDGNTMSSPLGTFSSRIKGAYLLGLIKKNEYELLNLLRKIRNEFSHEVFVGFYIEEDSENDQRMINILSEILDRMEGGYFEEVDVKTYKHDMKKQIILRESIVKQILFEYVQKFEDRITEVKRIECDI